MAEYTQVVWRPERVVMIAYHVDPYKGSEPWVGWGRACETARYFETWVICHTFYCQEGISRYLAEHGPIPGLHFVYLPSTRIERLFQKTPLRFYASYYLWFRRAYDLAAELHKKERFDILHQSNWATYREPGYPWKLDIPFVLGPVGGMENVPWRFLPSLGFRGALREGLRNIANSLLFRLSPRIERAARHAEALLVSYSQAKELFKAIHGLDATVLTNTCIASVNTSRKPKSPSQRPLRILWSGRCQTRKAFPLLACALQKIPANTSYQLRILGEGPQKERWMRLCSQLGIARNCTWMGWLCRNEAIAQLEWADVFVFTSLRDQLGTVILEALSYGVPVICMDHSASSDVVTETCGIKLGVTTPTQFQTELRDAIASLADDRDRLWRLAKGAQERARLYTWEENGKQMAKVYERILAMRDSGAYADSG